jgi:peptide chain release factor 2
MLRSDSKLKLCGAIFDAPAKQRQLTVLEDEIGDPEFWNQPEKSQRIMQERKRLEESIQRSAAVAVTASDIDTLFELGREGENVSGEIEREMKALSARLEQLETAMLLSGPNDARDAIMTIHPGAGGTESQDWAEMLLRMYLRWAERHGFQTTITDRLEGEGAGVKSVTFEINGENVYGQLQAEVGVHRLVRISPFDANARRHTSFASVFVFPQIDEDINIDIKPDDLKIDVFRASGAGGQHVNKTSSAIRLTHLPTNIVVQCQNERSQHKNRATAIKMLRARLARLEEEKREAEQAAKYQSQAKTGFGSQIRNYFLHPDQRVKDSRTGYLVGNFQSVLDGNALQGFLDSFLRWRMGKQAVAEK